MESIMALAKGTEIPATPIDGKVSTLLVPTLANPEHPTVTELTGADVVDISRYLTKDGFSFDPSQETVSDERESSVQVFGQPGTKSVDGATLTVIDNTNTELEESANEAIDTMVEGETGYIVRRRGKDWDLPYEAEQKVTVIPIKYGEKKHVATESNTVIRSTVPFFATGPWFIDKATVTATAEG
jgi:hypothetical protein